MNDLQFIQNFISQFSDFCSFTNNDYKAAYHPSLHPNGVCFWFNPPLNEEKKSYPCVSGHLLLGHDNSVFVEDFNSGAFYNITECLGDSLKNAVYSIKKRTQIQ